MPVQRKVADILARPETSESMFRHIASGGTLIDYCRNRNFCYGDVATWISEDAERTRRYREALAHRKEWVIESIIGQLSDIAQADVADLCDDEGRIKPPAQWPVSLRRAVTQYTATPVKGGISVKVSLADKLKALELTGKNLGLFKDQIEMTVNMSLADMVAEASTIIEGEYNELHTSRKGTVQALGEGQDRNAGGTSDRILEAEGATQE